MKHGGLIILSVLLALCCGLVGCAKKDQVDTAPVEKSFQSADPTLKESADKAVTAVKAGDYAGAMAGLQSLAGQAKLTPEQKQAVDDLIVKIKEQLTKMGNEAVEGGKKALDDMQKSLPK